MKYFIIILVGQDSKFVTSDLLIGFLLSAQQETTCEKKMEINLDIATANNFQITISVSTFDRTEQVLLKICKHINLPIEYMQYFSLYLVKNDATTTGDDDNMVILRKLFDFESPYMSHKTLRNSNRIMIRKRY